MRSKVVIVKNIIHTAVVQVAKFHKFQFENLLLCSGYTGIYWAPCHGTMVNDLV